MSSVLSPSSWLPFWGQRDERSGFSLSLGLEQRGKTSVILKKKALPLWPDGWGMMEPISSFLLKRKEKIQNFSFQSRDSYLKKKTFDYFLLLSN